MNTQGNLRIGRWHFLAAVIAVLGVAPLTLADEVDDLLRDGAAGLAEHRPADALVKFEQAARHSPADSRPAFFTGAALAQLARFDEALIHLDRARMLGSTHPQLDFQTGWVQMRLGMFTAAIDSLQRYEQTTGGNGQSSEFLGRCYLALNDVDTAEQYLNEALRRDPALKDSVNLALTEIAYRRGDAQAVARGLAGTVLANGPVGNALQLNLQTIAMKAYTAQAAGDGKPYHFSLTLGMGYNSNVLRLNDSAFLPVDVTGREAGVFTATFEARYDLLNTGEDYLGVGYVIQGNVYFANSQENNSTFEQTAYLDYAHTFDELTSASLLVAHQYLSIGGDSFRQRVTVRPAVARHITEWFTMEVAYIFAYHEYFGTNSAFTDRDGFSHGVTTTGFFMPPGTDLVIRLGYGYYTYDADGAFFDHDSHIISISLQHPIPMIDVMAEVTYSHTFYENDLAGSRDDDTDMVTLRLTKQFTDMISAYVQYDFVTNNSPVPPFEYDQHAVTAGVTFTF